MKFEVAERTDTGRVRKRNEDYYGKYIKNDSDSAIFCIADGMGGYGFGNIASKIVIDSIIKILSDLKNLNVQPELFVNQIFENAQVQLRDYKINNQIDLFGTTLAIILFFKDTTTSANIGDTRIYSLLKNNLMQESYDHTYVNELLQAEQITEDEARSHPKRHVLTKALMGEESIILPYTQIKTFNPDETFIIASDGLYNMVDEVFMTSAILENDLETAADKLLNEAYSNGAKDNITFQIIRAIPS